MEKSPLLLDTLQHMLLLSENFEMLFLNHFPSETIFSFLYRQHYFQPDKS